MVYKLVHNADITVGWDQSSLHVKGAGIVYWPARDGRLNVDTDTYLTNSTTIPGTDHVHKANDRSSASGGAFEIGEVTNHIVLENYIIFTTRLSKVFAWNTSSEVDISQLRPFELTTFYPSDASRSFQIHDLQGSFRSFAIFTKSGEVLIAYRPLLDAFFHASTSATPPEDPLPHPSRISSLQDQDVISLAFGDYHIHALHANGTISSFGHDPHNLGGFGLGDRITALFRGVQNDPGSDDGVLDGSRRRTVWFEPLMETRIKYLHNQGRPWEAGVPADTDIINRIMNENEMRNRYGDFFENEGRQWEEGITGENEMGAYFALKVAAAGWHSAALVLVDEEKAERARQKHIVPAQVRGTGEMLVRSIDKLNRTLWESLFGFVVWSLGPLLSIGKWFLGVPTRRRPMMDRSPAEEAKNDGVRYVWEDQPLPRLWEAGEGNDGTENTNTVWRSTVG